jgi:hypothetical protein
MAEEIIALVRSAALALSEVINEPANRFTKEHIAKIMPITIEFMSAVSTAAAKKLRLAF